LPAEIFGPHSTCCRAVNVMSHEFHLSDQELLMAVDGELPARGVARAESHLAKCWECRARKQQLEAAIADFIRFQRSSFEDQIPSPDGPRALLRAQLNQQAHTNSSSNLLSLFGQRLGWAALVAVLLIVGVTPVVWHELTRQNAAEPVLVTVPNPAFTPGATLFLSQPDVCREPRAKNKMVPIALQKRVFAEYGIRTAQPGAYEVDYLITPALGGADDIHNLWPQSSKAALWNAQVKDALEDRLRDMVCEGQLDLHVAQREIAVNWIEAYKKYFHTDRPLTDAR
jgi:hypothetical protein